MVNAVALGDLVRAAPVERAGDAGLTVLSMTRAGLVPQDTVFKKSVASRDLTKYKVVRPNQLVVGIHIDEGALGFSGPDQAGIVSPAYTLWDLSDPPRVHIPYLDRFLRSPRALTHFVSKYRKTADRRGKLTREQFLALDVPLPPIEEQRRIAALLDATDALRAKRSQALAKLDTLTEAIFIDMFAGDLDRWEYRSVEALAAPSKNAIRTGPFGSQLLHDEFVADGVAVLGIDNVVTNEFRWAERRFITPQKYDGLRRYTVAGGDVLVTIMGTCGRVAIVPEDIPLAINTKHLCCVTTDREVLLPAWFRACLLFHPRVRRQLGATHGAVMPGLNMGLIKRAEIPIPSLETQRAFAVRTDELRDQRELASTGEREVDTLFAALQQRAFRGEL